MVPVLQDWPSSGVKITVLSLTTTLLVLKQNSLKTFLLLESRAVIIRHSVWNNFFTNSCQKGQADSVFLVLSRIELSISNVGSFYLIFLAKNLHFQTNNFYTCKLLFVCSFLCIPEKYQTNVYYDVCRKKEKNLSEISVARLYFVYVSFLLLS